MPLTFEEAQKKSKKVLTFEEASKAPIAGAPEELTPPAVMKWQMDLINQGNQRLGNALQAAATPSNIDLLMQEEMRNFIPTPQGALALRKQQLEERYQAIERGLPDPYPNLPWPVGEGDERPTINTDVVREITEDLPAIPRVAARSGAAVGNFATDLLKFFATPTGAAVAAPGVTGRIATGLLAGQMAKDTPHAVVEGTKKVFDPEGDAISRTEGAIEAITTPLFALQTAKHALQGKPIIRGRDKNAPIDVETKVEPLPEITPPIVRPSIMQRAEELRIERELAEETKQAAIDAKKKVEEAAKQIEEVTGGKEKFDDTAKAEEAKQLAAQEMSVRLSDREALERMSKGEENTPTQPLWTAKEKKGEEEVYVIPNREVEAEHKRRFTDLGKAETVREEGQVPRKIPGVSVEDMRLRLLEDDAAKGKVPVEAVTEYLEQRRAKAQADVEVADLKRQVAETEARAKALAVPVAEHTLPTEPTRPRSETPEFKQTELAEQPEIARPALTPTNVKGSAKYGVPAEEQALLAERNKLVTQELPKYPEGSKGRNEIQRNIDEIDAELAKIQGRKNIILRDVPAEKPNLVKPVAPVPERSLPTKYKAPAEPEFTPEAQGITPPKAQVIKPVFKKSPGFEPEIKQAEVTPPKTPVEKPQGMQVKAALKKAKKRRGETGAILPEGNEGRFRQEPPRTFVANTTAELIKDKPFGLMPDKNGGIHVPSLLARLGNGISKEERQLLKDAGVDKFIQENAVGGKIDRVKLASWIDDNVVLDTPSYGMEGKVSEAKREYDKMTHEWYDNLDIKLKDSVDRAKKEARFGEKESNADYLSWRNQFIDDLSADSKIDLQESRKNFDKYIELSQKINDEPRDTSPRATTAYEYVSATDKPKPAWAGEGKNVTRVDVVIPKKEVVKMLDSYDAYSGEQHKQTTMEPDLWRGDIPKGGVHDYDNTTGWGMVQYMDGPNGERVALLAEGQSRWGQEMREVKSAYEVRTDNRGYTYHVYDIKDKKPISVDASKAEAEAMMQSMIKEDLRNANVSDHPLLEKYNEHLLKASIAQAKKDGATHIVISDAKTAMMTEKLENFANIDSLEKKGTIQEYTQLRDNNTLKEFGDVKYKDGKIYLDLLSGLDSKDIDFLRKQGWKIEREEGFQQNYDEILPNIAAQLTGDKGVKVSLSEHKNAIEKGGTVLNEGELNRVVNTFNEEAQKGRVVKQFENLNELAGAREEAARMSTETQEYDAHLRKINGKLVPVIAELSVEGARLKDLVDSLSRDVTNNARLRSNLIFKNTDGTPKTDISGMMYSLENIKDAPFKLTGSEQVEALGKSTNIIKFAEAADSYSDSKLFNQLYDAGKLIGQLDAEGKMIMPMRHVPNPVHALIQRDLTKKYISLEDRVALINYLLNNPTKQVYWAAQDSKGNWIKANADPTFFKEQPGHTDVELFQTAFREGSVFNVNNTVARVVPVVLTPKRGIYEDQGNYGYGHVADNKEAQALSKTPPGRQFKADIRIQKIDKKFLKENFPGAYEAGEAGGPPIIFAEQSAFTQLKDLPPTGMRLKEAVEKNKEKGMVNFNAGPLSVESLNNFLDATVETGKKLFGGLRREVDKIEKNPGITPEQRGPIARAFARWDASVDALTGRFAELPTHDLNKLIKENKLTEAQTQKVLRYLHEMSDYGKTDIKLTPAETKVMEWVNKNGYEPVARFADESGVLIKDKDGTQRERQYKDYYSPDQVSPPVIRQIKENPGSPETAALKEAWHKHNLKAIERKYGITGERAEKMSREVIDAQIGVWNSGRTTSQSNFAALNRAEGLGLPWEMVEQNLVESVRRYGTRGARHISTFREIQNDPKISASLGLVDTRGVRHELPAGWQNVAGVEPVQNMMRRVFGYDQYHTYGERFGTKFSRAVGTQALGVGSAIRDVFFYPQQVSRYVQNPQHVVNNVKAMFTMWGNRRRALANRAVRDSYGEFDVSRYADMEFGTWDWISDKTRTLSGRNIADELPRRHAFQAGIYWAAERVAAAKNGDVTARRQLMNVAKDQFGEGELAALLDNKAKPFTNEIAEKIAKGYVDAVHASYGPRDVPYWMLEGKFAPWVSMARWSTAQYNNFVRDVAKEAKNGNYIPLIASTLAMAGLGLLWQEEIYPMIRGRKRPEVATVKELEEEGGKEEWVNKVGNLISQSGNAGIVGALAGDLMQYGMNPQGELRTPIFAPGVTFGQETMKSVGDLLQAIDQGQDPLPALQDVLDGYARNMSQNYRLAKDNISDNTKKEDARDKRVWERLTDRESAAGLPEKEYGVGLDTREFKETEDMEEARKIFQERILPRLKKDAKTPEHLKKSLEGLKNNPNKIYPSPFGDTAGGIDFAEFGGFIEKTQTKKEAEEKFGRWTKAMGLDAQRDAIVDEELKKLK